MNIKQSYQNWLDWFSSDPEIMAELKAVQEDPKALEDRFYRDLALAPPGCGGCWALAPTG